MPGDLLEQLIRHNAWANALVFAAFERAGAPMLDLPGYDGDALRERLRHLAAVERAFVDVFEGTLTGEPEPPSEAGALSAYLAEGSQRLIRVAAEAGSDALEQRLFVPWWMREFSAADIFGQVLAHSAQHRAELAWELARHGVDTGEHDYIRWVAGGRPAPGEEPAA